MDWQNYSTHEHAAERFDAALLPIGTLEGHDGGPVGTDNLIPAALCRRLADRMQIPRLPLMPYGITSSLLAYPGGCSLSPATLGAFLFEIGQGFLSVMCLSANGRFKICDNEHRAPSGARCSYSLLCTECLLHPSPALPSHIPVSTHSKSIACTPSAV